MSLKYFGPPKLGRMDLDVVGSRFLRREHFRRGKCADDGRNPISIAELDRCVLERWRDDVLGSGQNGDARSLRIKDRTGSDLSLIAQLRPHGLDRLSRPWIGEGELDSGHTTRHQGLCHIDCGGQIIQANDGDNSMLMQ